MSRTGCRYSRPRHSRRLRGYVSFPDDTRRADLSTTSTDDVVESRSVVQNVTRTLVRQWCHLSIKLISDHNPVYSLVIHKREVTPDTHMRPN